MKILFVNRWFHPKNLHALVNYKNIELTIVRSVTDINLYDLSLFDCVYSPCDPIDVSRYSDTVFIFGPHFSVFPDEKLISIISRKACYITPSEWVMQCWKLSPYSNGLNFMSIPFGVDTHKFCEIKPFVDRNFVFIYYKSRQPQELQCIEKFLNEKDIQYKIFSYHSKYNESDYLDFLQNSRFGIWVDAHESQGFALEEALSCNVPLLVWNIQSMNQEYGQNYPDIKATTIPYWDDRCGEFFYDTSDFPEKSKRFFQRLNLYKPREFVLENLSIPVCEKMFINMIEQLTE
jgi:hypothetical protein